MGTGLGIQLFDNRAFDARCKKDKTLPNLALSPFFKIPRFYTFRKFPCTCVFTLVLCSTFGRPVEKKRAWDQGKMER